MMLRVFMVERRLKWLIEVPQEGDTDFTLRQFMYQLLVLRLKVQWEHYLHYGLFVSVEVKDSGKGKKKLKGNTVEDE